MSTQKPKPTDWVQVHDGAAMSGLRWDCGHCETRSVGPFKVWVSNQLACVAICGQCRQPAYLLDRTPDGVAFPRARPGRLIAHVPEPISTVFEEARTAIAARAFTAAALLLRIVVLRIAFDKQVVNGSC